MSKNSDFWRERSERDLAAVINKSERAVNREIKAMFAEANKTIEKDITKLYEQLDDITLSEAKRQTKTFQLTRFQLINQQLDNTVTALYKDIDKESRALLDNLYTDGALSGSFVNVNTRAAAHASMRDYSRLKFPYFDKREQWQAAPADILEKHKEKLRSRLRDTLRTGLIRGDGVDIMTRRLNEITDIGFSNCRRLIRTESLYAFNQGALLGYVNSGAEYIEFIATWDARTSQVCMDLDGAVIPASKARPGENMPPMHPNCRSTICAYHGPVPSAPTESTPPGVIGYAPGEHLKDRLAKMSESELKSFEMEQKQALRAAADHDQYKRYKKTLGPDAPSSFEKFRDIKYNNPEAYKELTAAYRSFPKNSGAAYGALDRFSEEADEHARKYYASVRSMKTDYKRIAKNTNYSESEILSVKNYLFMDEHNLSDGRRRFDPQYDISQSWQRLIDGKEIKEHDIVLIKHELREMKLVKSGMPQNEAHAIASNEYNYKQAIERNGENG